MLFEKSVRWFIPALLLAAACTSCEKDDENGNGGGKTPNPVFWETSAREMMSLSGPVRSATTQVVMQGSTEEETGYFFLNSKEFDAQGRLVKYDPIGLSGTFEYNIPTTVSEYSYDAEGRLSSIKTVDFGAETEYTLTYGDHDNYVPLPLSMGDLRIFLVRGLVKVASADGQELLTWEDGKAILTTKSFTGTSRTEITFENGYPKSAATTGLVASTTLYTWNEDGSPLRIEESSDEQRSVTTFSTNVPGYPVLEESYQPGEDGALLTKVEYLYSDKGDLAKVWCPDSEAAGFFVEQYQDDFQEFDAYGNWTGALRTYLSTEEQYPLERQIEYFE